MFRVSTSIEVDDTTKSRGRGGIFGGLKRLIAGDTFFLSRYCAERGPGEVGVAPTLQGSVRALELDGSESRLLAGSSYLASSPSLTLDTQFQGFKGLLTGESLFFIEVAGAGALIVSAFGRLQEFDVTPTSFPCTR